MNAEEVLLDNGFEGIKYLTNYSYDTALVGVTNTCQAVYDYDLMIEWLMNEKQFTYEDAVEWIDYNTERALSYIGEGHPLILYRFVV